MSPNPATGEVVVEQRSAPPVSAKGGGSQASGTSPSGGINAVQVYDHYGRLRLTQPGQGTSMVRLQLHTLPAGLYVVHILHGQSVVSRQRLQVL